jgi:hypothetical protein
MTAALVGTPVAIDSGGTYTAESGSNRIVAFVVMAEDSTTARTLNSLSFGGDSATVVANQASGTRMTVAIAYVLEANIPSGAQTVTATFNTAPNETARIHCYTFSGCAQSSPVTSSVGQTGAVASFTQTLDPTIVNGFLVAGAIAAVNSTGYTWTNAAEVFDEALTNSRTSSAYLLIDGTTEQIVANRGSTTSQGFAAAAFAPASAVLPGPSIIVAPRRQVFVIDKTIQH